MRICFTASEIKMIDYGYINSNYENLLSEIRSYEDRFERKITLVAVTKSGSDEELIALAKSGVTDIGENRPGELRRRGDLLRALGYTPRLHEIGTLQRNKVKLILDSVHLIHSVDSIALAEEISKRARAINVKIPVLMEINSAEEAAKGGISPSLAEEFYQKLRCLDGISLRGIMTMGPVCDSQEKIRPYFKLTKSIFDSIEQKYGFDGEGIISMGMSDSYRTAIEEGATLVRVGRKLFDKNEGRI